MFKAAGNQEPRTITKNQRNPASKPRICKDYAASGPEMVFAYMVTFMCAITLSQKYTSGMRPLYLQRVILINGGLLME